jgi:hypothetical protein
VLLFSFYATRANREQKCVDGYRESIRTTLQRQGHITEQGDSTPIPSASSQQSPKISRVNRVVSRGLAHRDARARSNSAASKFDTSETVWHLSESALRPYWIQPVTTR